MCLSFLYPYIENYLFEYIYIKKNPRPKLQLYKT